MDYSLIWAGIIALGVFMYVVLDGFDLGIGMLFSLCPEASHRDAMMHSIAPIWDGNETWLVLGGAGLFAAFPLVYSTVLPALYLPLILMLVCLVFRGVAFELRGKARRTRHLWELAFMAGSAGASFFQGVALGAYISGIEVVDGRYAGGGFEWLSPFSLFTGVGLMVTYALLGCGWLIAKTEGELQRRMYRLATPLTLALLATMAVVSAWTPLHDPAIARFWFSMPNLLWLAPVPVLVLASAYGLCRAVQRRAQLLPFLLGIVLVALGYLGLLISLWPHIIPPSISLWDAAAPLSSQRFALVGAVIILPIIAIYTTLGYWVFRGKVREHEHGYH